MNSTYKMLKLVQKDLLGNDMQSSGSDIKCLPMQ